MIELVNSSSKVLMRESRHLGSFRDVVSHQPVGVLVRDPLPRGVWIGKESSAIEALLDAFKGSKLGTVVEGQRTDRQARRDLRHLTRRSRSFK